LRIDARASLAYSEPVGFVDDHPMVGSMVAKVRQDRRAGVPNAAAAPRWSCASAGCKGAAAALIS
jgi:hypothetical protein